MIAIVLRIVIALVGPAPSELATGIRATAPRDVTSDAVAIDHASSAVIAGAAFDLPPDLLLAIAHHESRYQASAVTAEAGGKLSCGVMTPEPMHDAERCSAATSSLLAGYLHGARHLRGWLAAAHGNVRIALLGYAGGYRMISACRAGPVLRVRGKVTLDLCRTPEIFAARAARIRRRPAQT